MDNLSKIFIKIRYILLPTLIVVFAFILVYLLLWWLAFIKIDLYEADNDLTMFVLPAILSYIVFNRFVFKRWKNWLQVGGEKFMLTFPIISMGFMIAGCYYGREDLVIYYTKTEEVERVDDIKTPVKLKVYLIKNVVLEGEDPAFKEVALNYKGTNRLFHYHAAPFITKEKGMKLYWFCKRYDEIANDEIDLESAKKEFKRKTDRMFSSYLTFRTNNDNNQIKRNPDKQYFKKHPYFKLVNYGRDDYLPMIKISQIKLSEAGKSLESNSLYNDEIILFTSAEFKESVKSYNYPFQYTWIFIFHLIVVVFVPLDTYEYDKFKEEKSFMTRLMM